MKSQKCFTIMGDNKIYFRSDNSEIIKEFSFEKIKNYPNIPFHVHLWDDHTDYRSIVGSFLRDEVFERYNILSRFHPREMYILLPDDTQILERRALEEFFLESAKPKKIISEYECHYMTSKEKNYISIAETCRMIVLTLIKNEAIKEQNYLEKKEYDIEELKRHIRSLGSDFDLNNSQIYLNGKGLTIYNSLGSMVSYENILDNFICKNTIE